MRITIHQKRIEIKSIDKWPKPKKDNQWKKGRSAWAMANYAMNASSDFKEMIGRILSDCHIKKQNFCCEPEAVAGLGKGFGRGGSRNHDMLMIGENDCVIGIEAKVSETFDKEIGKILSESVTKKERAEKLIKYFVQKDDSNLRSIGYQLFTATRGTLCSAAKENKPYAIFLVVVFTGDVEKEHDYTEKFDKNNEDFIKFLQCVNANENGMIERKVNDKLIKCWIRKVEVKVKESNGDYSFRY